MKKKFIIVTIDGPAASGKSTVAKLLAKKLGFTHLDSGAIYRSIALYFKNKGLLNLSEEEQKEGLKYFSYYLSGKPSDKRHFVCGKDVTEEIRSREVSSLSSELSTLSFVRELATNLQRAMACFQNDSAGFTN